jgi:peptidoglycan/LPS O-acetylase OafA/YrhL
VYGHFTFVGQKYPFLILLSLGLPFLFQVSKNLKVDRYIGELSYPIYLVHPTIILVGDRFIDKRIGGMALTLLSIVAAVILNELICAPIERWRQKRVA